MYFDFSGSKSHTKNVPYFPTDYAPGSHTEVRGTILEISVFSRSSFIWPDESLKPLFEYRNVIFSFFKIIQNNEMHS